MGPQDFLFCNKVLDNSIRDAPADEVELGNGRGQAFKLDALRTAERVEELFRVAVQTALVGHMDREDLAVWSRVAHVPIF
jgi:hypothetical protein